MQGACGEDQANLGGSMEFIISSSLDNPSVNIFPPLLLGSIPTKSGASYFTKESGGETPRSDILFQTNDKLPNDSIEYPTC